MKKILGLLLLLPLIANAITARSYIVTDMNGAVILEKNADQVRSIASITKLFVAEQAIKFDLDERIKIEEADISTGHMRTTPLKAGEYYTRYELIQLALVSSDNVAARVLAKSSPPDTIYAHLVEGSGIDARNKSSARQLAQAARELYTTKVGQFSILDRTSVGNRRSTNPLINKPGWHFLLSKTGFINQAGGCLVVIVMIKDELMAISILGANVRERWRDLIEIRKQLGDYDFYVLAKNNPKAKQAKHRKLKKNSRRR
jgi:D-alanyl-D-alanine endopeptidase (penicillin-binding protein 7)